MVTAAALGDARGLPVVGVCSLDAVGEGARTVVTDARRREVYWARYDASGARVDGPGVVRPEGFAVAGPYVGRPGVRRAARRARSRPAAVTTAGLLRAAAPQLADPASAGPLVPLYLRRPDAVPPTASKAVTQAVTVELRADGRRRPGPPSWRSRRTSSRPTPGRRRCTATSCRTADTRHYLVAENGTGVVGWAGLIAYDDEAHVSTIGVARGRQGEGIGGAAARRAAGRGRPAQPGGAARGARRQRARDRPVPAARVRRDRPAAAATTSRAARTPS